MRVDPNKLIPWRISSRGKETGKILLDRSLQGHRHVYHMLTWPYAQAIFEDGRLRLSSVRSWDDPYEKKWCEILFGGESKLAGIRAYGQCWTTSQFDEPLWRMAGFGKSDPIVRIRCRVDALVEAGRELISRLPGSLFLGRVHYRREQQLLALAQSVITRKCKEVTRMAAGMLLQKRTAFRFEREVRLLWLSREPAEPAATINIDTPAVITQVMTTPYASLAQHRSIKSYVERYGIEVKRSAVMLTS